MLYLPQTMQDIVGQIYGHHILDQAESWTNVSNEIRFWFGSRPKM